MAMLDMVSARPSEFINSTLFVSLNLVDFWLTERLLAVGGVEMNRVSLFYPALASGECNFNVALTKAGLALLAALVLLWLGKAKLLWLLNVGIAAVVLSNTVCFLSYLAGLYGWFR